MIKSAVALLFFLLFSFSALAEQNLYQVLGLKNNATHEEIKKAWKGLVRANHPDRFIGDEVAVKSATEKMAIINAAETVLGNEALRYYYDLISGRGENHQRWAKTSDNSNETSLKKRFRDIGSHKNNQKQNPFTTNPRPQPQASPRPSASPSPSPSPSPTPEEKKTTSSIQDPYFEFFRKNSSTDNYWREIYRTYIVDTPAETDPARQMILLKLLTVPMDDWKFDALARAVILKFQNVENPMVAILKSTLAAEDPKMRKIAVTLMYYALVKERSMDLFKMDKAQAESYLVERLNDTSSAVQERAKFAVEKLGVSVQENFNAQSVLESLSSDDAKIRAKAFKQLIQIPEFSDAEMKSLAKELLIRNKLFNRYFLPHLPPEMAAILEVFARAKNLSAVAEEIRYFSATTVSPQHRLNAKALMERAFTPKTASVGRCEAVFK